MTFMVGEKQITLKGDPLLIKAECSLKTIQKTWEEEDQGSLLELWNFEIEEEINDKGEEAEIKGEKEDFPMSVPIQTIGGHICNT